MKLRLNMFPRIALILLAASALIAITACSQQGSYSEFADMTAKTASLTSVELGADGLPLHPEHLKKMMIQHADLQFDAQSDREFNLFLRAVTSQDKGIFVKDNSELGQSAMIHTYEIRVRPEHFDSLTWHILQAPGKLKRQYIYAEDASLDFANLSQTTEAQQDDLEKVGEKLKTASDTMEINELWAERARLTQALTSAKEEMKSIQAKTAWSTINVTVMSKPADATYTSQLGRAFGEGWKGLQMVILALAYLWPLWVVLALFFGWLRVYQRRKSTKVTAA